MSYLLEALRKVEREKERRNPLSFGSVVPDSEPRQVRRTGLIVTLLLVNLLLLGAGLFWYFSQETRELTVEAPTTQTTSTGAGAATINEERADEPKVGEGKMARALDDSPEPISEPGAPESKAPVQLVQPARDSTTAGNQELRQSPAQASSLVAVETLKPPTLETEPKVAVAPETKSDKPEAAGSISSQSEAQMQPQPQPQPQPRSEPEVAQTPRIQVEEPAPLRSSRPGVQPLREFTAVMDGVKSGCHVELTVGGELLQVMLAGVRCPSAGGEQAKKARMFTTRAAFARAVEVRQWGEDSEGRLLCDLHTESGVFLNDALVAAGLAWADGSGLAQAEDQARAQGRGMWKLSLD